MNKFIYTTLLVTPLVITVIASYAGAGSTLGLDGPFMSGVNDAIGNNERGRSLYADLPTIAALSVDEPERQALEAEIEAGTATAAEKARYYQLTDNMMQYHRSIYSEVDDETYQAQVAALNYVSVQDRIAALQAACANGDNAQGCDKELLNALENPTPLSAEAQAAHDRAVDSKRAAMAGVVPCSNSAIQNTANTLKKDGELPKDWDDMDHLTAAMDAFQKDQLARGKSLADACSSAIGAATYYVHRARNQYLAQLEEEARRAAAEAERARQEYNERLGRELAQVLNDVRQGGTCDGADCYKIVDFYDGQEHTIDDITGRRALGGKDINEDYSPAGIR